MKLFFLTIFFVTCFSGKAQKNAIDHFTTSANIASDYILNKSSLNKGLFSLGKSFIENIGQYGEYFAENKKSGKILYGYEGMGMPVLITTNGLIYLQRRIKNEGKRKDNSNERAEEREKRTEVNDGAITIQWVNANPSPQIIAEEISTVYHTYGLLKQKASAYGKITIKDLYPGIDVVYTFNDKYSQSGFEYSLVVHPGADISKVQIKYGGDIQRIQKNKSGNTVLHSQLGAIQETSPVCFYAEDSLDNSNQAIKKTVTAQLITNEKTKTGKFLVSSNYDKTKTLIIDPFITTLGGLIGPNANLAYDIDFDYDGNIYVRGGGDQFAPCELAKYDKNGNLLWVFHGTLTTPSWIFGHSQGGWVVEKSTGKIFIGQGVNWDYLGVQIIRLTNAGIYDNYITTADPNLNENWKMLWVCNNSNPKILAAGGGVTSNLNLSVCTPPSPTLSSLNITGIPTITTQDIADFIVDPTDNAMYSIMCSIDPLASYINNRIYKHTAPYNSGTIAWTTVTGYNNLVEGASRPYTNTVNTSVNSLTVNGSYLFYWDGKYLKAFNKNTGTDVGTPLMISGNTVLMQGGIIADACNNVFVGDKDGLIKVYNFNGSVFDDAAAPDIPIPGFSSSHTYALAYDIGKKLLYACGEGYVASFDISNYCASQIYSVDINSNCLTGQATAQLQPAAPAGSTITYNLYNGSTFVTSNSTGVFTGLLPNIPYTIRAVINIACSGAQTEKVFTMVAPVISTTATTPATCTQNIGTITVSVGTGTAPYSYSIDGGGYQTSNSFAGLTVGNHTVTLKDANGCTDTKTVTVPLSGLNTVTVTAGTNETICEGTSVQLNAVSNAGTFSWSPTTGLNNSTVLNPVASPVQTTKYYLTATSAPCTKTDSLIVFVNAAPISNAGVSTSICFGKSTQLNGSGGVQYSWSPATYLDNPAIANPNVLQPLQNTTYTLKVVDAIGCASLNTSTVTITVRPPEKVFAGNDTSIAINQPLQLNAADVNHTGFTQYNWAPAYGLNNTSIQTPLAVLDKNISYFISATTADNCVGRDTINIKVFKGPDIYVPNAFSPNGDGKNDLLRAIPIGLNSFSYFVIYNRYGEKVFYTTDRVKGWDGTINGKAQNSGGFTWIAEGVDYKGVNIKRSGSVILVR